MDLHLQSPKEEDKSMDKIKLIVNIGWWILLIYMAVIFTMIYLDSRKHTEYYALVSERPPYDPNLLTKVGDNYMLPNGEVVPAWYFRASTISECKPMQRLSELWNKHGMVILYATILLSLITFGSNNLDRIKRFFERFKEE